MSDEFKEPYKADGSFVRPWKKWGKDLPPRSYVITGWGEHLFNGQRVPIVAKVRWTREQMEQAYPKLTIIPELGGPVTVQGVRYVLHALQKNEVPSVIADVYVESRNKRPTDHLGGDFRPWSADELAEMDRKLKELWLDGGKRGTVISRAARLGTGIIQKQRRLNTRERFVVWLTRALRV